VDLPSPKAKEDSMLLAPEDTLEDRSTDSFD
jgi:hypothetical protein